VPLSELDSQTTHELRKHCAISEAWMRLLHSSLDNHLISSNHLVTDEETATLLSNLLSSEADNEATLIHILNNR